MTRSEKAPLVRKTLAGLYPKTACFLKAGKDYELLFAVILSAQATDVSVNAATKVLFQKLPDLSDYTEENRKVLEDAVRSVGLWRAKSSNILKTAEILRTQYYGKVPADRKALMSLPGAGYKTSGVILGELFHAPLIPVDTHVYRVSHRLGLVPEKDTPEKTEEDLERLYREEATIELHRQFILFGRNVCLAKNPLCSACPLRKLCSHPAVK
jgi:endonuclease-3